MGTPPPESTDPVTRLPEPGWLPDPARLDLERYWNGWNWTAQTRDRVTRAPYHSAAPSSGRPGNASPLRLRWVMALALTAVVAVVAVVMSTNAGLRPWDPPQASEAGVGVPEQAGLDYPVFGSDSTVIHLATGMVVQQESIDVTWLLASNDDVVAQVDDAMREALAQNPYVFVSGWRVRVEPARASVLPDYIYPADEAERRRVATASAVAAILADPSMIAASSARTTVGALHDAVLRVGSYDSEVGAFIEAGERPETSARVARSQEAYGVLVDGSAVCNGYAQAFHLLAAGAGITSVVVTGEANGGVTTGAHAWNRVLIDGEWLVVDTTWDDAQDALPRRDYLLLNPDDMLLRTRVANNSWVVDANMGMFQ